MHLDVLEGVPSRRGSPQGLVDRQLQILGIQDALALGKAHDERVDGPKLLLLQLDAHRPQFLRQPTATRRGADLPVLGRIADVLWIDEGGNHRLRAAGRTEDGCREGRAHLFNPALPPGVIHGGEHGNISVEPDQQRGGLVVMFDDQRRTAFLERLKNGIEVASEFGSRNDFEHEAIVDRRFIRVKRHRWWLSLIAMTMLAACQQAPVIASPKPTAAPSPSTSPLAACPSTAALGGPQLVVRNLPAPDDLALGLDARLYFSDITAGTVSILNSDGSVERLAAGLKEPEGIVQQGRQYGSGPLLVAEQGRNRVVRIAMDFQSHAVSVWRAFPNASGGAGIDGPSCRTATSSYRTVRTACCGA